MQNRKRKRNRSFLEGTFAEKVFYESKPFLCIGAAVYLLKELQLHKLGQVSAMLLLASGLFIIVERLRYRGYLK